MVCRAIEVIGEVSFDEELWWQLRGECACGTPSHHDGWQVRELSVIASAVPAGDIDIDNS